MSFDDALKELKKSRSIVNMNPGFQEQLRGWGKPQSGPSKVARPTTPIAGNSTSPISPTSPKSPVVEIGPMDVISWRDAEADENG